MSMKKLMLSSLVVCVLLLFIAYIVMKVSVSVLVVPQFAQVSQQTSSSFIQILSRDGSPIESVRKDFQQQRLMWQPLSHYSSSIQSLIIISEDKRFYRHQGVDWIALINAFRGMLLGERVRGASTISMQVVGMIVPELHRKGSRTYWQKIRQMLYAQALEQHWSKEQVLEAYLNLVPLRGEIVGVAAGAQTFFQKYPNALNSRESAVLAAMLRSPNVDKDVLVRRACDLIQQLNQSVPNVVLQKKESCEYLDRFVQNALGHTFQKLLDTPEDAPHFAIQLLKAYQHLKLPLGESISSSIDKHLQKFIQQRIQSRLVDLFQEKVSDAAVVVLDNRTGEVLAYVGSSGKLSGAKYVDHASALRQAGSTLKPFLYAQALGQKRLTAASLLNDDVLSLEVGSGLYVPQNYDRGFKGWVSVRTALASSLNIPAVKTLTMLDIEEFRDTLVALGLPLTETGDYYGYSLALGSADVTLLSLTNAYRALANLGMYSPVRWIPDTVLSYRSESSSMKSLANDNNEEMQNAIDEQKPRRVLDQASSWIIGDILSDRYARVPTFGADSALSTPFWTAVKTGTSKDMRDNWTVGWSSMYTVGVWVGNSAGESMRNISGVSGAAPIWHDVMAYLHNNNPSVQPARPDEVVAQNIKYIPALEPNRQEYFLPGTQMKIVQLPVENASNTRITSFISTPTDGTILAWDPDIPQENQRLKMMAQQINHVLPTQVYWVLNGVKIGSGNPFYWPLKVGKFTLELFSQEGNKLDTIHFQVRGIR